MRVLQTCKILWGKYLAAELESEDVNEGHVYSVRLEAHEDMKAAEKEPSAQNEKRHRIALGKLKILEVSETETSIRLVIGKIETLEKQLMVIEARTAKEKRQAFFSFGRGWDYKEVQYKCMSGDCEDPERGPVLQCPRCGIPWCATCFRRWKLRCGGGGNESEKACSNYQFRVKAYKPIV